MTPSPFQQNPGESILFRSQPSKTWYVLAGRIGIGILELIIFIFISITAFTNLLNFLLASLIPIPLADGISRILFQGIAPVLVAAWFVEDTFSIFISELVLTDQRLWTRGTPYAWTPAHDISLSDIKSMTLRRDAIFMRLTNSKKTQVLMTSDAKDLVKMFRQFTGK
jgi:hypothetical protein